MSILLFGSSGGSFYLSPFLHLRLQFGYLHGRFHLEIFNGITTFFLDGLEFSFNSFEALYIFEKLLRHSRGGFLRSVKGYLDVGEITEEGGLFL